MDTNRLHMPETVLFGNPLTDEQVKAAKRLVSRQADSETLIAMLGLDEPRHEPKGYTHHINPKSWARRPQ